jgi:hypothetical protein
MKLTNQLAKHMRDVYLGGNWTSVNLKDILADVDWECALHKIGDLNNIATIVNHMNYYVHEVSKVLEGGPLLAKDTYSFEHPPIDSQEDWEEMLKQVFHDGEHFSELIEQLPDNVLLDDFLDGKYGNYMRNLMGIIEHFHYHLGQIVLIKKLLQSKS